VWCAQPWSCMDAAPGCRLQRRSSANILTAWPGRVAQGPRAGRARAPWSCTPCIVGAPVVENRTVRGSARARRRSELVSCPSRVTSVGDQPTSSVSAVQLMPENKAGSNVSGLCADGPFTAMAYARCDSQLSFEATWSRGAATHCLAVARPDAGSRASPGGPGHFAAARYARAAAAAREPGHRLRSRVQKHPNRERHNGDFTFTVP